MPKPMASNRSPGETAECMMSFKCRPLCPTVLGGTAAFSLLAMNTGTPFPGLNGANLHFPQTTEGVMALMSISR